LPQTHRRFDAYLDVVQSNELKSMVRIWGGRSQMRKDECIATIRQGLSDPARVQAVLANLNPYEHTALALVKQMGGAIEAGALAVALRTTGVPLPTTRHPYSEDTTTLIQPLIRRGLLLSDYRADPGGLWHSSYGGGVVFSDERLLVDIGPVECVPFAITPVASPTSSTYRRPPAVILDIVGILQAIDTLGGLHLTKAGVVRTNDIRKLARAMNWSEDGITLDGLAFPSPALAWISALWRAGLLSVQGDGLALSEPIDRFARRSYAEQVGTLLRGFVAARAWSEWQMPSWYDREDYRVWARLALTLALAALPETSDGFVAVDDLDQALFERIGEHFSLSYPPRKPYFFNKTPDEVRREEAAWRAKLRTDWQTRERRWLGAALASWLYFLGVVELGLEDGAPVSLRLTDIGRAVLHLEQDQVVDVPAAPQGAWLVQPNFDVQVYLEHITPERLAFLERHAERVQAHQHTAQYRLTRDSVYRGLESGTSLDELLSGLQSGAGMAVPQNVVVELRAWAALREQIRLRRRARLLEYPNDQVRRTALAEGLAGMPVGDRFVLLDGSAPPEQQIKTRVDYTDPLPKCLSVAEDGVITITKPTRDLLVESQLDHWAERTAGGSWRLTAANVARSVKSGTPVRALFRWLEERLTHPLPLLLGVALRAWAGEAPNVDLATVTVLRCRQPAVLEAITRSEKLRPYIRGTLAPDVLLVDTQSVKMLHEHLAWAGIRISDVVDGAANRG
jgi:hypothetical protein